MSGLEDKLQKRPSRQVRVRKGAACPAPPHDNMRQRPAKCQPPTVHDSTVHDCTFEYMYEWMMIGSTNDSTPGSRKIRILCKYFTAPCSTRNRSITDDRRHIRCSEPQVANTLQDLPVKINTTSARLRYLNHALAEEGRSFRWTRLAKENSELPIRPTPRSECSRAIQIFMFGECTAAEGPGPETKASGLFV